jgi:serine/threonine protein kinase/WD40 repeat protein
MNAPKHDPETLYTEAKKIVSLEERKRFLQRACGDDQALKVRLESLLRAGDRADSFFEDVPFPFHDSNTTLVSETLQHSDQSDLDLKPNDKIGPYKLMEKVGEGGFGVVWAAEQREPIKQRVALKIIKVGMDTKQVVARFEAERQALALMNHPNIAKVLGAGSTESGRPYFCMELIRGIHITQYCDENKLNTQERLDLFTKVCNAIQHAHQKGVIHRDIKPANILVTLHDGVPVPKVIDFGVAKAVEMELTEKTIYTQIQQFIGTPAYMSPEQAEMSGLDIDTRSDIYSLGVLLYELLTGRTPFSAQELMQSGLDEMRRMIREKDPERPSMRLSSLQAEERTTAAQRRNIALPELIRSLRGDLDWIVIKALEKDRTRRYETANGLAADIKRHLENEPIVARPPSTAYRLQKAWKRNKVFYTSATAVFVALCAGIAISLWQAREASLAKENETKQRIAADAARSEAETASKMAKELQTVAESKEIEALNLADQMQNLAEKMRLQSYVSDMKVADHALANNNRSLALEALNRHRPPKGQNDLRDLAWRYLWTMTRGDEQKVWMPIDSITTSLKYSPDGSWLATIGFDEKLRLWGAKTAINMSDTSQPVAVFDASVESGTLTHFEPFTNSPVFTTDGKWMAFIQSGDLNLIKTTNWQITSNLGAAIPQIAFSPSGRSLAALSGKSIKIWDLETLTPRSIPCPPDLSPIRATKNWLYWTQDETHLIAGSSHSNKVILLEAQNGNLSQVFETSGFHTLAFACKKNWLACVGLTGKTQLWDIKSGQVLADRESQSGTVLAAEISPDERFLATTSTEQTVNIWSLPELRHTKSLYGHQSEVWSVAFHPVEKTLLSSAKELRILLWNESAWETNMNEPTTEKSSLFLGFQGDMNSIRSLENRGITRYWKIINNELIPDFDLKIPARTDGDSVYILNDGKVAAIPHTDSIDLVETKTGRNVNSFDLTSLGISTFSHFSLSTDLQWIILMANRQWKLIRTNPLEIIETFPAVKQTGASYRPVFAPDDLSVVFCNPEFSFIQWDLKRHKVINEFKGHQWLPFSCAFSSDGKFLATSCHDGEARIWNVENGSLHVPPLRGHVRGVNRVRFTNDGKTIITGGDDQTVRFWNAETGQEMIIIEGAYNAILAAEDTTLVLNNRQNRANNIIAIPTLEEIDRLDAFHTTHSAQ